MKTKPKQGNTENTNMPETFKQEGKHKSYIIYTGNKTTSDYKHGNQESITKVRPGNI